MQHTSIGSNNQVDLEYLALQVSSILKEIDIAVARIDMVNKMLEKSLGGMKIAIAIYNENESDPTLHWMKYPLGVKDCAQTAEPEECQEILYMLLRNNTERLSAFRKRLKELLDKK